jgi:hypothetical protein
VGLENRESSQELSEVQNPDAYQCWGRPSPVKVGGAGLFPASVGPSLQLAVAYFDFRRRRPLPELYLLKFLVIIRQSILTKKQEEPMSDKIDGLGEGCPTVRKELEARIERLRQAAEGMEDREAATQLLMQILALEIELLGKE